MTQADFDLLPGLLTPEQFRAATGLNRSLVAQLVHDGVLRVYVPPAPKNPEKRKKWKVKRHTGRFYKPDAARLTGFVL